MLGLAGTAMAFAGSREEEVERWLRALRLYGEAGATLRAVGVDEASDAAIVASTAGSFTNDGGDLDTLACVITCAEEFARQRGAQTIGTAELLFAVMRVYGAAFDRALAARATDRGELVERLGCAPPGTSEPPA